MISRSIVVWGSLTFLLFSVVCIALRIPRTNYDLTTRAQAALDAAEIPKQAIRFDGRDAILAGPVPTREVKQRADAIVAGLEGVRIVHNRLDVAPGDVTEQRKAKLQLEIDRLLGEAAIAFEASSDVLARSGREVLDRVAVLLHRFPQQPLEVAGHTDSLGEVAGNLDLSRRRAQVVVEYLLRRGVERKRLMSVGYGPHRPIADNTTDEGRLRNRRVEINAK
jgi:OOP family OmpA-OmpF porin